MPKTQEHLKVLVIGSGPIIIGQAAEFDYAGAQACRSLKEENIEVVLVNSNPATIMTDPNMADRVYLDPLTTGVLKNIIRKEKPDCILPTLGGQTGLNLAMELAESGFLAEQNVRLLGTSVEAIRKAEDREAFKETMESIGEPVIDSVIANDVETAVDFAKEVGYPVIIRPAYTLGGTGGGIVEDEEELRQTCTDGLRASRVHQVLVEKSVAGWKEIEFEALRDSKGNCITVCSMENIDPVGIHTGDSIVVAPAQTLRDEEYQMLRSASLNIISALGIEGGCNVQFALDTESMQYYVIEVNPRLSRSSALASKATGYPIARVATKIAVGYSLDEILNKVTGKTYACFEPTLDYVVVKFPRWPFDKFTKADKRLGTKMKATGEIMSIGSNFESAFLKAVRSLELGLSSLEFKDALDLADDAMEERLNIKDHERIFYVCEALRRGITPEKINEITQIDLFYLNKFHKIIRLEEDLRQGKVKMDEPLMRCIKRMGFADKAIAKWLGKPELDIRAMRKSWNIFPSYKMVDTCGAEFEAVSPYFYSTYESENEAWEPKPNTVVVLGSGPIRIGQGIEFDYCSVHCVWALKAAGYETIIINNNPETVSTDFDTSDRLYFEPLTPEDVWNVLETEKPIGVVAQFGGQTAIKLTKSVADAGWTILGTQPKFIDMAEDREEFDALLERLNIARPKGGMVFTAEEAVEVANKLGYPVLVRPSYVLGGQGMEIAYSKEEIIEYMRIINRVEQEHPILVDKYIIGKELEVDAICDGQDILVPGIMEHIERAGIHSGDSISLYPAVSIDKAMTDKIMETTRKLALGLEVRGLVNIQYIVKDDELYVIEVNPRSSRTVPYISKVTGIPMVDIATQLMFGGKVADFGFGTGLYPSRGIYAVKVPVFSFEKLPGLDTALGPEMKSTGEVLGLSYSLDEAILKGLYASGIKIPRGGAVLITVADNDKAEVVEIADGFDRLGFKLYATVGTCGLLDDNHISAYTCHKLGQGRPDIVGLISSGRINLVINTPSRNNRKTEKDGFLIRRTSVENSIPCLTSLDTARALINSLKLIKEDSDIEPLALQDIK